MNINELRAELVIADKKLRKSHEYYIMLEREYQALRNHADILEAILKVYNIKVPEFYG